jgi:histidinol dehydrogenase
MIAKIIFMIAETNCTGQPIPMLASTRVADILADVQARGDAAVLDFRRPDAASVTWN